MRAAPECRAGLTCAWASSSSLSRTRCTTAVSCRSRNRYSHRRRRRRHRRCHLRNLPSRRSSPQEAWARWGRRGRWGPERTRSSSEAAAPAAGTAVSG
eukprot:1536737-Prymnesium_polylepis.1